MKKFLSATICLAMLSMSTSCLLNPPADDDDDFVVPGGDTEVDLTKFVGSQLDFEVTWNDFDNTAIVETEEVVTDQSSEEYADFVENQSFTNVVNINFDGNQATVSNQVPNVTVITDGAHVVADSEAAGVEYVLSGTATDGSFKLYSSAASKVTLNGANITSGKSAAINVQSSKPVYLVAAAETVNVLADAATYTTTNGTEDQKGCVFSEGPLIVSGSGALSVNALYNHAICSDKYVRLRAGSNVTVNKAPSDALHANDKIIIAGGQFSATVEGDAIDCEAGGVEVRGGRTRVAVTAAASKAVKSAGNVTINNAQVLLMTQGGAYFNSADQDIKSAAGIRCPGSVVVSGSELSVLSSGLAGKGINCDGAFTVTDSQVKVKATGATFTYNSKSSSAKAITAEGNVTINSGKVWAMALGGDGCEGVESKMSMTINDGEVMVSASDNGLNASSGIVINGGAVYGFSAENDALDSNTTFTLNGGTVVLSGSANAESGVDCDNDFVVNGGTLIAVGADTSVPAAQCTQPVLVYKGSMTAGKLLTIADNAGAQVASYVVPRDYAPLTMVFTSPALQANGSYVIYADGTYRNGQTFAGFTTGAEYTPGTLVAQYTQSQTVMQVGN